MPRARVPPVPATALLFAFLIGCAAVAYGRWTQPLVDAERALASGRTDAREAYAAAEARLGRSRVTRQLFASDYNRAVYNHIALLYRAGDFDAVLEKAAAAPAGAAPHFWSGSALLARAMGEKRADARLVWLTRAEDELKQALQAAPDDWDTKFNYELAARLAADLRQRPSKTTDVQMQLLRPQPRAAQPARRVG